MCVSIFFYQLTGIGVGAFAFLFFFLSLISLHSGWLACAPLTIWSLSTALPTLSPRWAVGHSTTTATTLRFLSPFLPSSSSPSFRQQRRLPSLLSLAVYISICIFVCQWSASKLMVRAFNSPVNCDSHLSSVLTSGRKWRVDSLCVKPKTHPPQTITCSIPRFDKTDSTTPNTGTSP